MATPHLRARAMFGSNLVAMPTPMNPDGSLDETGVVALSRHLVSTGCDGVVVGGTTGEAPTLTRAELVRTVELARAGAGPDVRLVVGVGTNDTATSIDAARTIAGTGADALLVVTPYYSRPTQDGVVAHVRAVADATELPVMLYDVPARTGLAMTADTIITLAGHPLIEAIKDAKGDLAEMMAVRAQTALAYYCGIDELNLPSLAAGAAGLVSVTGAVAADRNRAMIESIDAGELAGALRIDDELRSLTAALMRRGPAAATAKTALRALGVIDHAAVRAPLLETADADAAIISELVAGGRLAAAG